MANDHETPFIKTIDMYENKNILQKLNDLICIMYPHDLLDLKRPT